MTREQILGRLRQECERAGSQAAWAKRHGMSAAYVSDVLSGKREPAGKILSALGVERVVLYRQGKTNE